MAYTLPLTEALKQARWKVKIRDKKTREPPHVTVLRAADAWRIDLRTGAFMDDLPDRSEVPSELIALVRSEANWQRLRAAWDEMYPGNPVSGADNEE